MQTPFYHMLVEYLKSRDTSNANRLIMQELGNILVKKREDFITLLRYSDIPVSGNELDMELIDKFMNNIGTNRKLMVGTAFIVNQNNKRIGFDGQEEISDAGVKAVHKVMFNYFNAAEQYANAGGGGAWAGAIDSVAKVSGQIVQGAQNKKRNLAQETLDKKMNARQAVVDSVLQERLKERDLQFKKQTEKEKTKKYLLIGTISVVGIGLIITGIYLVRKFKK